MLRDKVYSISILPNEDGETEYERTDRIEREVWDGEHTEAFARFVSRYPHDFCGDLIQNAKQEPDDAKLGKQLRVMIEAWIEEFAAEEAENV